MDAAIWERAVDFHGHQCPGLAIGVAASLAALDFFGADPSKDEELVCISENDACGVDGVQALTGCSVGKGNLLFYPSGKMAFNFYSRTTGKSVRLYFKLTNDEELSREDFQNKILNAPRDQVFDYSNPRIALPEPARLFTSVLCKKCGERAPEHKMRLQDGEVVCLDCFNSYERELPCK